MARTTERSRQPQRATRSGRNFDTQSARAAAQYYTTDSTAREILPQEQPQQKPKRWVRRSRRPEFDYAVMARHRHNFLSYVLIVAFFGALTLMLVYSARLTAARVELEGARVALVAMLDTNAALESEIYSRVDYDAIAYIAINQLGMIAPEEFQLVEIVVQPQSFFTHAADYDVATGNMSVASFFCSLTSLIGGH